jgi:tripartite-type tricarboxylate transporter receptor subunit TctC
MTRRVALAAAAFAAATAVLPTHVSAQPAWPNRPIKLIVPFAPGGGNDSISRMLGTKLSARLGQPIVIENKGGAGGTLGTDAVAKSPADGYTLLFASTSITTNAASGKNLPYDLGKDLEPIGQIGATPLLIVVANDSKATTLRELLDLARAKPNSISYGSGGVGAISHLGLELFASEAKVRLLHVPYKGTALAFTDLLGGHLQMLLSSPASAAPFTNTGKIRSLAVTSAQRSPFLPQLPTVAESGVPASSWSSGGDCWAPRGCRLQWSSGSMRS